jgi:hypothetical protein
MLDFAVGDGVVLLHGWNCFTEFNPTSGEVITNERATLGGLMMTANKFSRGRIIAAGKEGFMVEFPAGRNQVYGFIAPHFIRPLTVLEKLSSL